MTREQAARPFAMIRANWNFLGLDDPTTAEVWFGTVEEYMQEEAIQGAKDMIANEKQTPTAAVFREYCSAVRENRRRDQQEAERNRNGEEQIRCWECNDYGFVNIVYPNGTEAVRACNCQAVDRVFGSKAQERMREPMPKWKQEQLFGATEIPSQYELVRVSRAPVPSGDMIKDKESGRLRPRMKWGFVPYIPRSGREEVWLQYQKIERRKKA